MRTPEKVSTVATKPCGRLAAVLAGTMLLLSACAVGPKYTRPTAPVPGAYKELSGAYKEMNGWKTAQPQDKVLRGSWWELFNGPGPNALEERVNISNQNLKIAEAQFRQARALIRFYRSNYYPTVTAGASVTNNQLSANRSVNLASRNNHTIYQLPIDLSYEVDVWGRVRRTVEGVRASFQASAVDLETIRLAIHAELAVDYFELRSLDAELRLLDATVAAYEKALELTINRYKGGVAALAEVAQAETQLQTTRAQAIDLGVQRAQFDHAIATLIGQPASTSAIPLSPIPFYLPEIPMSLPSALLERRPDIAAAERRVAAANAQIGVARAAYFPSILLGAIGGFQSINLSSLLTWPSRMWAIGPSLIQTVFDGGRRRAVSDQALAAFDASVAAYRESVLTAFQEVEDNLAALRILDKEAKVQDLAVKAAERSLALSMNQYKGGLITYLEVVIAQSIALANERVAVDIQRRRMAASVLLIKALGGGWNVSSLSQY